MKSVVSVAVEERLSAASMRSEVPVIVVGRQLAAVVLEIAVTMAVVKRQLVVAMAAAEVR